MGSAVAVQAKSIHLPRGLIARRDEPFHDRIVRVTRCGRICMARKRDHPLDRIFRPMLVLREVDDVIWLVSFLDYDPGYIDLEQRTVQTIDNPYRA